MSRAIANAPDPILPRVLRRVPLKVYSIYRARPGEVGPYLVRVWTFAPGLAPELDPKPLFEGGQREAIEAVPAVADWHLLRTADDDPYLVESWL